MAGASRVRLHPVATADPRLLRWIVPTPLLGVPPEVRALIDAHIVDDVEIDAGEIRTRLAPGRSWENDGPQVRSALFAALTRMSSGEALTDDELAERVAAVLLRDVAPYAESHGGGIHVASVRDGILTVEMTGACKGCVLGSRTLDDLVRETVSAHFPQIRDVRAAKQKRSWLPLPRIIAATGDEN